jgi:hypothetical protein
VKTLTLLALLPAVACHARLDEPPPDLLAAGPLGIDLRGDWEFSYDAVPSNEPRAVVTANSAAAVTVAYAAPAGSDCGCSAQHLVVVLPRSISCDATMSFDWRHLGSLDESNSTALRVDFDPRPGDLDSGHAGQFYGSTWTGLSACAWRYELMHHFPKTPTIVDGHNDITLGQLIPAKDGDCRSSFDAIDIHVEGYSCSGDDMSASLANLAFR